MKLSLKEAIEAANKELSSMSKEEFEAAIAKNEHSDLHGILMQMRPWATTNEGQEAPPGVHSYQALHKQFEEMRFRWENRTRYAHELEAQLAEKQPRIDELEDLLAQACDQLQIAADYSDNETDPAVLARIKKALEEKSWIK